MKLIGCGYVVGNIQTGKDNGTLFCRFTLCIEEGKNIRNELDFILWDSAAKYFSENAQPDDDVYVEASPRISTTGDLYFRVNDFRIFER